MERLEWLLPGIFTATLPILAPMGTVKVRRVPPFVDATLYALTGVLLPPLVNQTSLPAAAKFFPMITMVWPGREEPEIPVISGLVADALP